MSSLARTVSPTQALDVVKDDPADNKILECALEANADVIISGDKHLLGLRSYGDIRIMTTREFLARE